MKKIYSLLLTAAALLVGTNAWGQNSVHLVNATDASKSGDYATLQAAIDAIAPGQTGTITLNGPQNLDAGVLIPHLSAADTVGGKRIANLERQHITIDLNGSDIMTKAGVKDACIALIKGELNIIGEGTIERAAVAYSSNWDRGAIVVSGTDGMKDGYTGNWPVYNGGGISVLPADKVDRSKQEWSSLYIGKDVYVESTQADTYGIGVQEIGSSAPGYGGFDKKFLGYSCVYTGKLNNTDNAMPMWNTTQSLKDTKHPEQGLAETQYQWSCFGVKVVIDGKVHGAVRGINILGSINQTPGVVESATARKYAAYPYYDHYFPYVKIGKDAEVYCEPSGISDNGNGGIYLGGWAVIDIEGAVHGQTGVMVKAGDVLVQDGSVYSDCTTAANSGNYHATVAGSGIFITSSASYAGESSVTVAGDSYIAGNGGNAIIDVCATSTSEQTNTAVTHIDITGGTIVAGDQGAISLGTETSNVTDISGGIVNGVVDIGDPSDEAERFHTDVTNLLPNTTEYHTTVIEDEDGKQTIVISQGAAPATEPGQATTPWSWCADNEQSGKNVAWTKKEDDEIPQNTTITLGELQIVSGTGAEAGARQQLTINSDAILQVDHLVMNEYARIIVKAGGKLIVKGTQGIVAPVVENIVLESDFQNKKYATFLFNPAVSSNKHPNATVEFGSYSFYKSSSNYQSQRFGVPTWEAVTSIKNDVSGLRTRIQYWGANGWENLGEFIQGTSEFANINRLNKPFDCYIFMSYQENPGAKYTMTGKLVGNVNNVISTGFRFTPFANSYTADLDIVEMLNNMTFADEANDKFIYIAAPNGNNGYSWQAVDETTLSMYGAQGYATNGKIAPLQPFIMHITGDWAEDHELNYEKMVWDPVMDPTHAVENGAPRRAASLNDNTAKLRVVVSNEQGELDDVKMIESTSITKRAEKYMNDDVNIYAHTDVNSAVVMNDNLEDTYFGFSTVKGGEFTISFDNVEGREFDLIDLETDVKVAVKDGETYSFSAAANTVADYRFKLVERANAPTAIDNTEAVKSVKGIYTITGQYLGEMNVWNTLPAGVYVVNGEKCVK